MQFRYIENKGLPKLAWIALIKKTIEVVEVVHGESVEAKDNWFCSGVWDGDFNEGDFTDTEFSCCTGCCLSESSVVFSTPSNMQEQVNVLRLGDTVYVSNSFPFLLAYTDSAMNPDYVDYEERFCGGIYGVNRRIEKVPLLDGRFIHIYRYSVLSLDVSTLEISDRKRESRLRFDSYSDYVLKVKEVLQRVADNSRHSERKCRYDMLSTISRGYDSAAVSALVKDVGCNRAFTFNRPNKYKDDDGSEIAKILGYETIYAEDADAFMRNESLLEAVISSSGSQAGLEYFIYDKYFFNSLVFVGGYGFIWKKNLFACNVNEVSHTLYNFYNSLVEVGLSLSFVCISPYLIGIDIAFANKLSNSLEMRPYSLGGDYDKPIPRRILEEAGVPREMFGQKKRGFSRSYHYDTLSRLKKKMSPNSYQHFAEFRKTIKRSRLIRFKHIVRFYVKEFPAYLRVLCMRLRLPFHIDVHKCGKTSSPMAQDLILWGMDVMKKRYASALQSE